VILKRLHVLLLISALTALCSAGSLWAQQAGDTTKLAGNWAYSLGPKTLFGLHLERDPARPDHLRGYVVSPEDFSFNVLNGTLLQFSKLSPKSEQQSVVSLDWKNGALQLRDPSPAHGNNESPTYLVRPIDTTNVDFTLFPSLPELRMKRITSEPRLASDWDSTRTYTPDDFAPDNDEMTAIVAKDQADRAANSHIDEHAMEKADSERRLQTEALLEKGLLHSGPDFDHAALIFQHGTTSNNYLLAHVLAVIAVSKGQSGAVWISAATLDRYLQSLHQPQIFGTQYKVLNKDPSTQEPYNRSLISDALRTYMGVPDQKSQDHQRIQLDVQRGVNTSAH
jgi:hypothetical protein